MKKREMLVAWASIILMILIAFWIGFTAGNEARRKHCEMWHEEMFHEKCSYCYYG